MIKTRIKHFKITSEKTTEDKTVAIIKPIAVANNSTEFGGRVSIGGEGL